VPTLIQLTCQKTKTLKNKYLKTRTKRASSKSGTEYSQIENDVISGTPEFGAIKG
jgi:hypothetical protein